MSDYPKFNSQKEYEHAAFSDLSDRRMTAAENNEYMLSADLYEKCLRESDLDVRAAWVRRIDYSVTQAQIDRGLKEVNWFVRVSWLGRLDFSMTDEQIDFNLSDTTIGYTTKETIFKRPEFVMTQLRVDRIFDENDPAFSGNMVAYTSQYYMDHPDFILNKEQIGVLSRCGVDIKLTNNVWPLKNTCIRTLVAKAALNETRHQDSTGKRRVML